MDPFSDPDSFRAVPWEECKIVLKGISQEDFVEKYPDPFLLLTGPESPVQSKRAIDNFLGGGDLSDTLGDTSAEYDDLSLTWTVIYLSFNPASANPTTIEIGRGPKNQISLPTFSEVSNYHAKFQKLPDSDIVTLNDLGSRNGTYLNREILMSGEPKPIKDRDKIRFSKFVEMQFLCAKTLHGLISFF